MLRQLERRPGPVSLIGHSRGGMLCWAIATRLQERAAHLILVGSPAPAVVAMMREYSAAPTSVAASAVAAAGARALRLLDPDCTVPACGCPYTDDLRRPLHPATRVLSIASRDDPIVPFGACRTPVGETVEVRGSHGGLVVNASVLRPIAQFLAAP